MCHSRTRDLPAVTREADLLVAAIGRAGLVRAEHVKPGAVVVDVGMNRVTDAAAAADLLGRERGARLRAARATRWWATCTRPPCARWPPRSPRCPGGVGPLTIAMLMSNTVKAAALRG